MVKIQYNVGNAVCLQSVFGHLSCGTPMARKGERTPDAVRIKISNALKGRKATDEQRRKISETRRRYNATHPQPCIGRKSSPEHRKRISLALKKRYANRPHHLKGRRMSEEHKRKISQANTGKKRSEETRCKLAASSRGRKYSEQARRNMSLARLGKPTGRTPMKGKKHTTEARRKMSVAQKGHKRNLGRKPSEETKHKYSARMMGNKYRLGIPHSPETRAKLSEKSRGRKHTPEARLKISLGNSGPRNAMWKGGISSGRGPEWTASLRRDIRQRDNHTCALCNEPSARLNVHHVIPYRLCILHQVAEPNAHRNLVVLCPKHHGWCEHHLAESIPLLQSTLAQHHGYSYDDLVPIVQAILHNC